MVRFTMCVRNRDSRAEETKLGLFTIRASCSRTAMAGTTSNAVLAAISGDEGGRGMVDAITGQ